MRWKNVPIPETIVIPLALGIGLEVIFSSHLFPLNSLWVALSAALFLFGICMIAWAVLVVGKHDLTTPDELITSGPYTFSRNPMYVGWMSINFSVLCFTQSLWLAVLCPISMLLTHFLAVIPEEVALSDRFEEGYRNYYQSVRRYL